MSGIDIFLAAFLAIGLSETVKIFFKVFFGESTESLAKLIKDFIIKKDREQKNE